ncbi:ATP-binding protein [Allosalinactinospora lopnorensis]|uniref:ATP-binding protein n=1 Tax=Allosalinactinospora lopnorensis TaxID=1352348 RepID=UPI000696AB56|nr:ATP-binding protein [Allosalinactinospora lopnorensis]
MQDPPELLYSDGMRESDDYTSPEVFSDVCSQMAIPFPDTPYSAESLRVEATDLWAVRDFVAKQARSRGIGSGALYNLLVAVTEVTANAVRHGHPPVTVCIWQDGGDLVCDVIDSGHWRPAESLGFVPPKSASDKGFGLWGVRMLCDSSQFHAGPAGTVVRLRIRI